MTILRSNPNVTNLFRPPRLPALLLALLPATMLIVACGGSVSPAASTSTSESGAPVSSAGGGGGATVEIPTIADGAYTSGTAHLELSGGRTETFDAGVLNGITISGSTILAFTSADNQKVVQIRLLPPGSGSGALAISTNVASTVFSMAGTWGQECQVKITRNNASGLSGEFTCKDAPAVAGLTALKVNVKGTFSAER